MKVSGPAPSAPGVQPSVTPAFPFLEETRKSLYIRVRVQPRACENRVDDAGGNALKLRVAAPPADGEANRAVIEFLSRILGVRKSALSMDSGLKSRVKRVRVQGMTLKTLEEAFSGFLELK